MRVLISGSTGFIGEALVRRLTELGHQPVRLVRSTPPDSLPSARWDPAARTIEPGALDGIDAVVHLAGESIASSRWTDAQKARILNSRVDGTTTLADAIAAAANPPGVLLSGSAIGLYGDRGDERVDETSSAAADFAATVSVAWEAAAQGAETDRTRVAYLRTGIVLDPSGGALREQLPFSDWASGAASARAVNGSAGSRCATRSKRLCIFCTPMMSPGRSTSPPRIRSRMPSSPRPSGQPSVDPRSSQRRAWPCGPGSDASFPVPCSRVALTCRRACSRAAATAFTIPRSDRPSTKCSADRQGLTIQTSSGIDRSRLLMSVPIRGSS